MPVAIYRSGGGEDYAFSFERQSDGEVRAYVQAMPGYGARPADLHSTHRRRDGNGRYFVCRDPPPRTMEAAMRVAAAWAELTDVYQRTGRPFPA